MTTINAALGNSTRFDNVTEKPHDSGIDQTSIAYDRMSARWELIDDLLGGSDTMRDRNQTWLSKEKGETSNEYAARLKRSFLRDFYADTLDKLVAKPFSKELQLKDGDKLPEMLSLIEKDADFDNTAVNEFARKLFYEALHRGIVHVLVEFPKVEDPENTSKAEERAAGAHPYWVIVPATQLIAWKFILGQNGRKILQSVRLRQTRIVDNGLYGEKNEEVIRVYTRGEGEAKATFEVYIRNASGVWELSRDEFGFLATTEIPFYTLQLNDHGAMESRPILWSLAEINLEHWQSNSDQKNLLHIARVPILFRKGWDEDTVKDPLEIGAQRAVTTTSPDADMRFVEHSGKALGAGDKDLENLQEHAELLGMQPLVRKANASLATSLAIGDSKEESELQAYARVTEQFFRMLYKKSGEIVNEELPEDFGVDIFNDFGLSSHAADDIMELIKMRLANEISRETFLGEIKRRDLISNSVDIDEEMSRIEEDITNSIPEIPPIEGEDLEDEEIADGPKKQTASANS
jgi:hypothetical protein